jgi:hypothetical protein
MLPDQSHSAQDEQPMPNHSNEPQQPRVEPEVIPPGRGRREFLSDQDDWAYARGATGTHRLYVGRIGPLAILMLMLFVGLLAGVILVLALGAVLLWLPALALVASAGLLLRLLRR